MTRRLHPKLSQQKIAKFFGRNNNGLVVYAGHKLVDKNRELYADAESEIVKRLLNGDTSTPSPVVTLATIKELVAAHYEISPSVFRQPPSRRDSIARNAPPKSSGEVLLGSEPKPFMPMARPIEAIMQRIGKDDIGLDQMESIRRYGAEPISGLQQFVIYVAFLSGSTKGNIAKCMGIEAELVAVAVENMGRRSQRDVGFSKQVGTYVASLSADIKRDIAMASHGNNNYASSRPALASATPNFRFAAP